MIGARQAVPRDEDEAADQGDVAAGRLSPEALAELTYRPVRPDELPDCVAVWRAGINDYTRQLNQPDVPDEPAPLLRLYGHLQASDPERFVAALVPDPASAGGERIVAFAAAAVRERLWYLSMLFVLPDYQRSGLGRLLLARVAPTVDPATIRATATDSAQPISNALYASVGIVPRVPLLNLTGLPERGAAFGDLPGGVRPTAFDDLVAGPPSSDGHRRLIDTVDALDRDTLGVAHPIEHRMLRQEGRRGWLYHGPDGAAVGYGYASEAGRVGPVAVRDESLLGPILGHLTTAVTARGAFALWLPGSADRAVVPALRAGFRLERFPVLLCWDRPFADLTRYLPISPGLL
ncbi:MAG: GNAT family N-acetyltransferase [Candidatus Limnocylindrales bacterium]